MPAPSLELEFVRAFVNTADRRAGTDALKDDAVEGRRFESWCAEWDLPNGSRTTRADLLALAEIREQIRGSLRANCAGLGEPATLAAALNRAMAEHGLALRLTANGVEIGGRPKKLLGHIYSRLVGAYLSAHTDNSWGRLKACAASDCEWAYFDYSRPVRGQWCSMAECGNRAKQAAFRARHARTAG